MQVSAQLRYFRASPRKVKLVIDVVRGLPVSRALHQLAVMPQSAARPVAKLLRSAVANAKQNLKYEGDLWVKSISVGQGPVLKRWQPRAMGRATPIRRPTAHLKLTLADQAKASKPKLSSTR